MVKRRARLLLQGPEAVEKCVSGPPHVLLEHSLTLCFIPPGRRAARCVLRSGSAPAGWREHGGCFGDTGDKAGGALKSQLCSQLAALCWRMVPPSGCVALAQVPTPPGLQRGFAQHGLTRARRGTPRCEASGARQRSPRTERRKRSAPPAPEGGREMAGDDSPPPVLHNHAP